MANLDVLAAGGVNKHTKRELADAYGDLTLAELGQLMRQGVLTGEEFSFLQDYTSGQAGGITTGAANIGLVNEQVAANATEAPQVDPSLGNTTIINQGGGDGGAAALAAEQRAQRLAEIAQLQAEINSLRAQKHEGVADLQNQVDRSKVFEDQERGEAKQENVFTQADIATGLAGRGLSRSGVKAGAVTRQEDALLRRLQGIGQQRGDERQGYLSDIERLRSSTRRGVEERQARIQGLQGG